MEINFIQTAAPTRHAVAYAIDSIFKHIILASWILSFKVSIVSGLSA